MKQSEIISLARENLIPELKSEQARAARIDKIVRGKTRLIRVPRSAGVEKRELAKLAESPWLRLVVRAGTQMLRAEGCYSADRDVKDMWAPWDRNGFDRRQIPLHEASIEHGTAYVTVLPGLAGAEHQAAMTPYSPMEFLAVYGDASDDEWPMYAIREIVQPDGTAIYRVYDERAVYFLGAAKNGAVEFIEERVHDLGVTPVVRYSPSLDLLGRAPGDVEPFVETARRICKTTYDRLLVQHYNSWRVRTATKLDQTTTDEDIEKMKMKLAHDDVLVGDADTEFDTLDESPLTGFNESHESDIEDLAALSQTSTTALSGKMVNVSADAITEAKASAYAKRDEARVTLGASHSQTLRLAALVEGRMEDAADYTVRISWADTDTRTLSQAIDALGKAATQLGVPEQKLWTMIPGVDVTRAAEWERYAAEHPTPEQVQADAYAADVARQLTPAQ